ncbi:tetratricopeptide repeat protein [Rhodobacteraceae bacterium D3-12]|nr:tetratricopeptide repeat protein [Rhodobacteraceae bacterium D3-12]
MSIHSVNLKLIVAATIAFAGFSPAVMSSTAFAQAQGPMPQAPDVAPEMPKVATPEGAPPVASADELYDQLKSADEAGAARIEREIEMLRARSGSPAMDLLLTRGLKALEEKQYGLAIEHFTALTDHAPEFAEGWYGRAQALAFSERPGPAVADLQRVLMLNPRHYDALYGLGTLFEQIEQPNEAYDAYKLVLEMHPHHQEARQRVQYLERSVNGTQL